MRVDMRAGMLVAVAGWAAAGVVAPAGSGDDSDAPQAVRSTRTISAPAAWRQR
jgi:hypothetical protein